MSRPVRIGDLAQITLPNEVQTHPIKLIDGDRIYISTGEGSSSLLVPVNGEYQVEGLDIDHQVEFLANDSPVMTGLFELDLALLEELDDKDLETLCQVDDYIKSLCEGDQLWINKTISKYGQTTFNQKPLGMRPREYYDYLESFISVAGANLALVRNDQQLLDRIIAQGYRPDIHLHLGLRHGGGYLEDHNGMDPMRTRRFTQDVVNFLREAELGPQVMGSFPHGLIDRTSIQAVNNTRLNDILWFLQPTINGQQNPLYRIALKSSLMFNDIFQGLLLLHLQYSGVSTTIPFSATDIMRKHLGHIMRTIIDHDVIRIQQRNSSVAQLAREKGNLAKRAIDDPTLKISTSVTIGRQSYSIFNPNEFIAREISKFIPYIYEPEEVHLTPQDRDGIFQVYSIIPNVFPDIIINVINMIERRIIELAEAHQKAMIRLTSK